MYIYIHISFVRYNRKFSGPMFVHDSLLLFYLRKRTTTTTTTGICFGDFSDWRNVTRNFVYPTFTFEVTVVHVIYMVLSVCDSTP